MPLYTGMTERKGIITIKVVLEGDVLTVSMKDEGRGIRDIRQRWSRYLRQREMERSGMGFTIMESFTLMFK